MAQHAAIRTSDLISPLGGDTHIDQTDRHYLNAASKPSALQYLDLDQVRGAALNPNSDAVGPLHLVTAADGGMND